VNPLLTVAAVSLPTIATIRAWMHPNYRNYRAYRRSLRAQRPCCGGMCTTADRTLLCPCGCGRNAGQHTPIRLPRQRTPEES